MLKSIVYSFPVQLLIYNLKKNQLLLLYWFLLFGSTTGLIGKLFGIPYLFLDPEYLGKVTPWSFFIIGIAIGLFIMAFNITCFILDSYRFAFLSVVSKPLLQYCINNAVIPLTYIVFYMVSFIGFQLDYEYNSLYTVSLKIGAFLIGLIFILVLFFLYFNLTNRSYFKRLANKFDRRLRRTSINKATIISRISLASRRKIRVDNYLTTKLKIKQTDSYQDYDKELVIRAFDYYHLNAVVIAVLFFIFVFILSAFRDTSAFQIPAAASVILVFTIFIMMTGPLVYWLRGWATTVMIGIIILANILFKYSIISSKHEAFGLNYHTTRPLYSSKQLKKYVDQKNYVRDTIETVKILNKWREKIGSKKPKIIFLCVSGGGERSALWTLNIIQKVDSILKGKFFQHTFLITGASGGMIGASYFRELYLRSLSDHSINPWSDVYTSHIARDILNPVVFNMAVNNPITNFKKFVYQGFKYNKDRGYTFERQLNQNTDFILDKPLSYYKEPEAKAIIPLILSSATIINDGRKLYISPQSISYMCVPGVYYKYEFGHKIKGVEFTRFFKDQNAEHVRFLTVLRMNATFPYVTPNIGLPSIPEIKIMDSGFSDNFGVNDAVRFAYVFKDWLKKNTSGIVLVSIRDSEKDHSVDFTDQRKSLFQNILSPIGSLYSNWDRLQDIMNDNSVEYLQASFKQIYRVDFEYEPGQSNLLNHKLKKPNEEKASLSWRLTTREKENIKNAIHTPAIQFSIEKLQKLLK